MKTAAPSPEELDRMVMRVQQGDNAEFERLILAVERELRVFVSARSSSLDMVEDILQNALVTCFQNIRGYEPRGTFLSWLKGIARNHLFRELRERSRALAVEPDELERMVVDYRLQELGPDGGPADGTWESEEGLLHLQRCLERLSERSRLMLERRYGDRLPVKRLAQHFKQSANAIAAALKRIRDALRACMASNEGIS